MAEEQLKLPTGLDGFAWPLEQRRNGFQFPVHRHAELEVNLVTAGTATYLVEDHRYDLTPGTQIWLFPAQNHVLIDQSADYVMWIAVFTPTMLQRICTDDVTRELCHQQPTSRFCKQLPDELAAQVLHLFKEAYGAQQEPARCNAALAHLCLSAWSAHRRADLVPPQRDVHPAVERAARLVRDSEEPITVAQLAAQAGLSASRLTRLFKQQTGVSLTHYRQRQQLERFLELYGRGRRRNMTEAALAAGFGSYAQFHRVFKQCFGYGPAAYRKRLRDEQNTAADAPSSG